MLAIQYELEKSDEVLKMNVFILEIGTTDDSLQFYIA